MLNDNTVEKLISFFAIEDPKERFEFGVNEAVLQNPEDEGQAEIITSLAVAAAITVPKASVIQALIDQAISARFNFQGLSEDEREKISYMLATVFMSSDEEFKQLAGSFRPQIVQVHDVYEMYKSMEGVVDGE